MCMKVKVKLMFLIISACVLLMPAVAHASWFGPQKIQNYLLQQDWQEVASILEPVDLENNSTVLRLIKGHAFLATNRNNESMCIFLNITSTTQLRTWDKWTEDFLVSHPRSLVAFYLRGDALARLGKWDLAIEAFDNALKIESTNTLVLNARGVAYAAKGELDKARLDLYRAAQKNASCFADVYCNLGFLNIQQKDMAEAAVRYFSKALDISPEFALALHGRGIAKLILNDKKAKRDIETGTKMSNCDTIKDLMVHNEVRYAARVSGMNLDILIKEAKMAGTVFTKKFTDLTARADMMGTLSRTFRQLNNLPGNQHLANFFGNRHVESVESIQRTFGNEGLEKYYANTNIKDYSISEIKRVGSYNERIQPSQRRVQFVFNTAAVIGGIIGTVHPGGKAAAIIGGAGSAVTGLSQGWSSRHAAFKTIINKFDNSSAHLTVHDSCNPGGVKIDVSQIQWEEGDWPFRAYYGLMYNLLAENVLLAEGDKERTTK